MTVNRAIEMIREQQAGKDDEPACMIGLQLIDMIREDERIAEILEEDLKQKSMSLDACAAKIKEEADRLHKERKGNVVCITPLMAEKIIRKFYGLPDPEEQAAQPAPVNTGIIELEDLL